MPNFEPSDEEHIDLAHLKVQEPILFYEELDLFEDELGDNGTAILNARVVSLFPSRFSHFFLSRAELLMRVELMLATFLARHGFMFPRIAAFLPAGR